ncbi:response regulator, partial [Elusimicrobiota bacterium]
LEVLKAIKDIVPELIAIMMTGYAVEDDLKSAIEMGAYGFLHKPFTKEELLSLLNTITGRDMCDSIMRVPVKEKKIYSIIKKSSIKKDLKEPPREYIEKRANRFLPIVPTKRKFQLKYVRMILISIFIPMIFVASGFYVIFHLVMSTAQLGRYAESKMADIFILMNIHLAAVTIVSALLAAWFALYVSQKIIGPIYRIENCLRDMLDGENYAIKIRKNDELQDLVKLLNKYILKDKKEEV